MLKFIWPKEFKVCGSVHLQSLESSGARQTAVAPSGFRMNVEVEVFSAVDGLLVGVICIVMPETC